MKEESLFYKECYRMAIEKGIYTDAEIADKTGLTRVTIGNLRYKKGAPTRKTLIKLGLLFGKSYDDMVELYNASLTTE